jgi:hypothetical protein
MNMVACSRTAADDIAANRARILFGLIVMLVGVMFMADRLDWMGFRLNVPLWPWLLALLGVARIGDGGGNGQSLNRSGMWLLAVGAWGLVTEYRLLGVSYGRTWPLLVIITGVFVIWRALDPVSNDCSEKDARR